MSVLDLGLLVVDSYSRPADVIDNARVGFEGISLPSHDLVLLVSVLLHKTEEREQMLCGMSTSCACTK